jgi:DNA segregation ATPase FtsK/SpoIIIE, S-DNA-T family
MKVFRNRTEEYEEIEQKQLERTDKNKGKDVDAKISYQYPKGQFRFPLIPDREQKNSDLKREEKKNGSSRMQEQTDKKQRRPVATEAQPERINPFMEKTRQARKEPLNSQSQRERRQPNVEPVQQENKSELRTKISKKSSRPFRPTEIPSPIYGFTKRPNQPEIVEFELRSDVEPFEKENHPFYVDQEVETHFQQDEIDAEEYEAIQDEIEAEVYEAIPDETEIEENQTIPDETDIEEYETVQDETDIEEYETVQDETDIEEYETIQNETEVEESETINTETEAIKDQSIQADVEEKKSSQRTHLPFNVLMLKQDKLILEQKKSVEMSTRTLNTPKTQEKELHKEPQINQTEFSRPEPTNQSYTFPGFDLLNPPVTRFAQENVDWIDNQEYLLNEALKNFGVRASVVNITQGPSVTRFEVQPEPGVKVNKITNLSDDIKLSLAAKDIRIEAPIPGKHTIGIEVPNKKSRPVLISEIIKTEAFRNSQSPLTAVLGLDISGAPIVTDLKKMPHGLIAGATGSGKSVCINSILISLLYKASPHDLKLLLIDPKMVELAPYNHIPHLVSPVITDVKAATAALKWAVDEMERRYELFVHAGVRDINRFNELAEEHKRYSEKLPFIVIIIDELADLMMMSPADVEESICRIAQKARACGIHLIIATQRPSVDVITGLIKANVPTRTAFSVSSQIDSRTIIDISGAEKLLGRGDMLFLENGSSKPVRLQGTFVSDAEIDLVVEHVRNQQEPQYLFHQEELLKKAQVVEEEDELFYEACEFVIDQSGASTSSLQRRFKIGYNRAARLIDMMEQQGFISEPKGSKPRDVLITEEELEQIQETSSSTFI